MALGQGLHETSTEILARFGIAQDKAPFPPELEVQREVREAVAHAAIIINQAVLDSREKSLALTHLEEALMWAGKAIFK